MPLSSPLEILQTVILVSLCGVMGGLISMLRRLQSLAAGSSPLIDTIALNAGQFGIGLSPVYGAIFAVVLYVVFLSGLLNSIIAPTAQAAVFPQFLDATPASTPDYTKTSGLGIHGRIRGKIGAGCLGPADREKHCAQSRQKEAAVSGIATARPSRVAGYNAFQWRVRHGSLDFRRNEKTEARRHHAGLSL